MLRRLFALAPFLLSLCGCASSWSVRTAPSSYPQQWPFQPNPAKLVFSRAITGFDRSGGGSAIGALVLGEDKRDENALVLPVAVAVAADGRIAVADLGRASVHLFLPAARRYQRLTGPKAEPMRTPVAVAFDGEGRLWVSDSSGPLYAFGADGAPLLTVHEAGGHPLRRPTGLAYSPQTKLLYVVDTAAHTIYALDSKGSLALTIGGRGTENGKFNFPTHAAWRAPGELYVADSLNFRVQIFDEKGKFLGAFGHHGDGSGDLAMPKGLAVDRDGVVYVADSLFDVVQLFDRKGSFLLALGRRGTDAGEFWLPSGVFFGGDELYVCDTYNHRVQVFRVVEGYDVAAR